MPYDEFLDWCAYLRKRGPLSLAKRMEHGFALLAVRLDTARGVRSSMEDFLPYRDKPEEEPVSVGNVFSMLKAKARKAA